MPDMNHPLNRQQENKICFYSAIKTNVAKAVPESENGYHFANVSWHKREPQHYHGLSSEGWNERIMHHFCLDKNQEVAAGGTPSLGEF